MLLCKLELWFVLMNEQFMCYNVSRAVTLRITATVCVRSQVRSCWICGGQSGTGAFSPTTAISPANFCPTNCSTIINHPTICSFDAESVIE
jgi:hypothetical protein